MVQCSCVHACVRVEFRCLLPSLHSVRFEVLRCAHKRIVNIMKVYIEKNYVQMEYDFVKNSNFINFTNFEVGIGSILSRPIRNESPLFGSEAPGAPDVSGHDHFGTECRSKCQFCSNSLFFTSFMTTSERTASI